MKLRPVALLTAFISPLTAMAHPGHPGHDFEWDFTPTVAVIVVFGLLVAGGLWNHHRRRDS